MTAGGIAIARRAVAWAVLVGSLAFVLSGISDAVGTDWASAQPQPQEGPVTYGPRGAVPQAACGPEDRPETDLQGRVPPADLLSGEALQPYTCNLELVGRFPSTSWANFEVYGDCAYWGRQVGVGGVQVLDVADPTRPLPTATLTTPAMLDPWESLRAHAGRGLLVADSQTNAFLDIYDVSQDCRTPRLLSSTYVGLGLGHEGWFSPDGMTYYMSTTSQFDPATLRPVDISDPTNPRVLASWQLEHQTHGGWTTEDGTRSYVCQQEAPPDDALLIVDTTEVATRQPDPEPSLVASISLGDNQWCQGAYRLTYDGRPHLLVFGERGGAPDCSRAEDGWATHAYPRFYDLSDERNPVHLADALLEVQLPDHCEETRGEGVALSEFGYSVHFCTPDRLYDPTILACSWFGSGLRVLDIRDPSNPVELAYYNDPGLGGVGTAARPVIRAERGEVWFVTGTGGFHVVRFRDGVWPFEAAPPCPEFPDLLYAHYNPGSACPTASTAAVGHPAPEGRVPLPRDRMRLDGGDPDPVAQAVTMSARLFGDGEVDRVVLATADAFADALAGAPLAGTAAPLLLTAGVGPLDGRVEEEIARVTGGDGVVLTLGGTAAVPEHVATAARAAAGDQPCAPPLPSTCRFGGTTREVTAALVADVVAAEHPDAPDIVLVARRDDPADALTGGAFAAAAGVPLLLTAPGSAHPETIDWLQRHGAATVVALGGPAAISEASLSALPAVKRVRVGGAERTATSVAIAQRLWGDVLDLGDDGALLVNVRHDRAWQAALIAAPASARLGLPQLGLEAPPNDLPPAVRSHLSTRSGVLMAVGGPDLVSDAQLVQASRARP